MEILGFIVLIACLVIGVRFGGLGLAAVSGIGLTFFVFVVGLVPGKPPIDVMLTIMAVVTCSGFLQASKGLDVMLKYAEKLLRKNPKQITILAPITTWFLTVLCGTGHVVYTMFPIIYDIAIKQNIRPERPMAAASVASQMGICASPASVAVVSMVAMLAGTTHPLGVVQILMVSIPATFCGVLVTGLWSLKRGKDLAKDEEFQAKLRDPEQRAYIYEEQAQNNAGVKLPSSAYKATFIFLLGGYVSVHYDEFKIFMRDNLNKLRAFGFISLIGLLAYYYYCIYYNGYSPEGAINTAHQLSPAGLVYTLGASLYLFAEFQYGFLAKIGTSLFSLLGRHSYFVYLAHPVAITYLALFMAKFNIVMTAVNSMVFYVLVVLFTLIVAIIFRKLGNTKYPKLNELTIGVYPKK
jgi:hypothetical protein